MYRNTILVPSVALAPRSHVPNGKMGNTVGRVDAGVPHTVDNYAPVMPLWCMMHSLSVPQPNKKKGLQQ